jgi:hypothetical protein
MRLTPRLGRGARQASPPFRRLSRTNAVDDPADRVPGSPSPFGQVDSLGTQVLGVRVASQVSQSLQLAEQVVHRLFGHLRLGCEVRRASVLRARVAQDGGVGSHQIREPGLLEPSKDAGADRIDRHAHQRAEQRRTEREFTTRCGAPGSGETMSTRGDADARFLAVTTAGLLGPEYFQAMNEVLVAAAGGPPDLAAIGAVMRRHGLTPAAPVMAVR